MFYSHSSFDIDGKAETRHSPGGPEEGDRDHSVLTPIQIVVSQKSMYCNNTTATSPQQQRYLVKAKKQWSIEEPMSVHCTVHASTSGVALPKYKVQPRPRLWSRQRVVASAKHEMSTVNVVVPLWNGDVPSSGLVKCLVDKRVVSADVHKRVLPKKIQSALFTYLQFRMKIQTSAKSGAAPRTMFM